MIIGRTEVEGTADGGDNELHRPEGSHTSQNGAVLVEYGVDSDNMSSWRNRMRRTAYRERGSRAHPSSRQGEWQL